MIEPCDIPLPDIPENDELFFDPTTVYSQVYMTETLQTNGNEIYGTVINPSDITFSNNAQQSIVAEILEKVVDDVVQDGKSCVDSEHNGDAKKDVVNNAGIGSIIMPKDDAETKLFLSYS